VTTTAAFVSQEVNEVYCFVERRLDWLSFSGATGGSESDSSAGTKIKRPQ
jgi:hypothetical protein